MKKRVQQEEILTQHEYDDTYYKYKSVYYNEERFISYMQDLYKLLKAYLYLFMYYLNKNNDNEY